MITDPATLRPADPTNIASALAFALRYDGRRRVHQADEVMSLIVAERLVRHLERCGFVVMKQPDRVAPSTSGMPAPDAERTG